MAAPLSVCTKEEQRSVICFCGLKVYQELKSIEDFQHNMGTVLYHGECIRQGLLSTGVLLLHDNVHPHTAIHTVQTLAKLGFKVLDHPTYIPNLAPSDYHLFDPIKDALRGHRFTSDEEVKEAVHECLAAKSKTFFLQTSRSLRNAGTSVLKSTGTMFKNDITLRFLVLLK
jgi:hypothetical protein